MRKPSAMLLGLCILLALFTGYKLASCWVEDPRVELLEELNDRWASGTGLLKSGMTKEEVHRLVGSPDNADDQYVWLWMYSDIPASSKRWIDLERHDSGLSCLYLLFDKNNRLMGDGYFHTFYNGDPWEQYSSLARLRDDEVQLLLGARPGPHSGGQ